MGDWPFRIRLHLLVTRVLKAIGPAYIRAHEHCRGHRDEIERSGQCGCFYCLEMFAPAEIQEWIHEGASTAMCPRCGIDSVIGSASGFSLSRGFLEQMHRYWFDRSYKVEL